MTDKNKALAPSEGLPNSVPALRLFEEYDQDSHDFCDEGHPFHQSRRQDHVIADFSGSGGLTCNPL